MASNPDATVYVSETSLETSESPPPRYHVDEDCHQVTAMDRVEEMPRAEAEEKCSRQAQCCSTIVALEDLD